ncbi:adenylyl-sulfate kinase [Candidatus Nitronereus thalassa]|uniref:Adenylyl-sulfate kinase n=1 Tax=Candidatus Nitronereus thalassa TaxID=3020898 RepID=A0ABU3K3M5_9BACT|nr:adenylyl-sulfate kinase [Candidatus Nitronereus thalassa]MDT7040987.1 adenylyl-sulfate kinase [Candidatus Nitronereus thalassa]
MKNTGFTIWFTGLPSAGKSTLARVLHEILDEAGLPVEILDGDEVRQRLTKGLGFTKEDRDENIRRIAFVSKLLTRVGAIAIVAAISPYRESRERAKAEIGNFLEVYVECPLQVCMKRDVKGLYAKASRGEIENFTGISDPYEPPISPDITVQTDNILPISNVTKILEHLVAHNYIPAAMIQTFFQEEESSRNLGKAMDPNLKTQWSI